jgi:hypothetical protein
MDNVTGMLNRVFRPGAARDAAARTVGDRGRSVGVAVDWWVDALRRREGLDQAALSSFATALREDLVKRLDSTFRVYLEVGHQPKGILRDAALAGGLDLDAFPQGTTMSVADARVEVSNALHAPYERIHGAPDR